MHGKRRESKLKLSQAEGSGGGLAALLLPYFMPRNLPSLFLRPVRLVGMPVAFAIFRFALVMPRARFQLKERPGISFFFLAIIFYLLGLSSSQKYLTMQITKYTKSPTIKTAAKKSKIKRISNILKTPLTFRSQIIPISKNYIPRLPCFCGLRQFTQISCFALVDLSIFRV